ncbi:MAG: septation protein A [Alphaproteobacteria bacterium]|nr:septation protein A [Alphaproteobacteria bacterium]
MTKKPPINQWLKLGLELGPLVVFFVANGRLGIFQATAAFMVATAIALGVSYALTRTLPVMPMVSGVVVLVFGGLTLYLADETFIKLKPTIVNAMFAMIMAGGLAFKKLFIKIVLESAVQLTDRGWLLLTRAWIAFFVFLALLNEVVWRNFSTDAWVSFKVFGIMPITLVFSFALVPIMMKHSAEPLKDDGR